MLPTLGIYGIQDAGDFPVPYWTHDHSLALMVDGRVEWVLELERHSRLKHDNQLPRMLERLIDEGIIELPEQFRLVSVDSFAGRTFLSASGSWRIEGDLPSFANAPPLQPARGRVKLKEIPAFHCFQELAHIASCLPFTGGFEEGSLLMHIDGGASQGNASAFHYRDGCFHHLYHGWDTVAPVLNFGANQLTHSIVGLNEDARLAAPGQIMGYSAYGCDSPELRAWLRRHGWFREHWADPGQFFEAARRDFGWQAETFDTHDPFLMDIAAACQTEFEETFLAFVTRFREQTGARQLYISGGALLNIEFNRKLIESGMFDKVFVPPCPSDCGLALGAAALAEYLDRGSVEIHSPFLNRTGLKPLERWGRPLDIPELAERIANGQVIAVYIGAAEVGPRALGHRSLLASPMHVRHKEYVSEEVKGRAWFRPVAPIVLDTLADELFPGATHTQLTDYMLCNVPVSSVWRDRIPGVVHVDGTARVQVIRENAPEQEIIRALLWELYQTHRIPCLINTSFNGPGEPIVHTPQQAIAAARRLNVDALVIDGCMEDYSPPDLKR